LLVLRYLRTLGSPGLGSHLVEEEEEEEEEEEIQALVRRDRLVRTAGRWRRRCGGEMALGIRFVMLVVSALYFPPYSTLLLYISFHNRTYTWQ
jgi:hypothetical protein